MKVRERSGQSGAPHLQNDLDGADRTVKFKGQKQPRFWKACVQQKYWHKPLRVYTWLSTRPIRVL